jgi:Pvc16 N-terminal domain/IPT/TIG domain
VSNPFAIAAVTTTFSQLLGQVSQDATLAGVTVSTRAPDRARAAAGTTRQINLFLYQVTPNSGWRNSDLAVRNDSGQLAGQPVLALDLHYLVSVYGQNDDDVDGHHLLAYAMSLVHDSPTFTRDQIRAAIVAQPAVGPSDLAEQVELVKLCPHALSPDDLYKLWSTFQTPYRLSVAYDASVVLIQRPHRQVVAPPVRAPAVTVLPFRYPVIDTLSPQALTAGGRLAIQGRNLQAPLTELRFGSLNVSPSLNTDQRIEVTLPAALSAGINTVQVIRQLALGTPATVHSGFASNLAAFMLLPQITNAPPISVAPGGLLTLTVSPPVGRAQDAALLIGDYVIELPARPLGSVPATSVGFPIPVAIVAGSYLLRLRVDGVESPLITDANPGSPTFNQYVGPMVTIT